MKKNPNQYIPRLSLLLCLSLFLFNCNPDNQILYQSEHFSIHPNRVEQGDLTAIAINDESIKSNYPISTQSNETIWELSQNLDSLPKYESSSSLLNALYKLALDESEMIISNDTIFTSNKKIQAANTSDLAYATILSMAITHPKIAMKNLLNKVKHGKIVQNSGTGGSWPISSDRMIWSTAAWELYLSTGDLDWLKKAYFIIKNSTEDDLNVIWDYKNHLFKGEASFLNKREQSYPAWMEPKDIAESYSLNIQAIHYNSLKVLIKMGKILSKDTQKYEHVSHALKGSIKQKFWLTDKNRYSQFLYQSDHLSASKKSENLGEAMLVLWDIIPMERKTAIVNNTSVSAYGISCFSPQIANVPTYHNNAIWPFVQAFWNQAAAQTNNMEAVHWGLSSSLRSTALFLTNKEYFHMTTGDFKNSEKNQDAHLKSSTGLLSNYYKILLGLHYKENQLEFHPFIPREFKGRQKLTGLKYRNTTLDIEVLGFGDKIASYKLDGTHYRTAIVPKDLEGHHKITIMMNNIIAPKSSFKTSEPIIAPRTPVLTYKDHQLNWTVIDEADHYKVYQNGELLLKTQDTYMSEVQFNEPVEFMIQAVDSMGNSSFYSKPLKLFTSSYQKFLEAEDFLIHRKKNYVEFNKKDNRIYYFQVKAPRIGTYTISFLYANGNGPIDAEDKCCTRSFWLNSGYLGSIVFPQRGKNNWNDYGYTNSFTVDLKRGNNFFKISYEDFNKNMNEKIDKIRIDKIRLLRKE